MAEKILGPEGSKRRKRFLWVPVLLIACLTLFVIGSAQAVHDLQFQLDGDTTSTAYSPPTGSNPPFDWNDIFNVSSSGGTQTVSVNSTNVGAGKTFASANFQRDFESGSGCTLNSSSTTFCTADDSTYATGSKDTLGIGNGGWQCNHDANVNNKIDIMNAYIVSYVAANGHKIFYFGLEKNTDNGTNDVGVWFLQGGASCATPSGHINWTGGHLDGDTLVVSEYSNGGGVSTVKAFRWAAAASGKLSGDGGCIDSNDNPNPKTGGCNNLPIATGADCKTASGGDALCATTNATGGLAWNQNVTTNWLTSNGTSVGNTVVPPDFFEGGIDITQAFQGQSGTTPSCFTTIVPDTRSAASPTATLFDFVTNQIGGCQSGLSTQENLTSPASIGTGTVSSGTDTATLNITGTANWGGTLTWYLCGPIASPTLCDNHGVSVTSRTVSNLSPATDFVSGTATLTSAGRYCWHAHFEPDAASKLAGVAAADDDGTNECFTVNPVTPTLTTSAGCGHAAPCILGTDTLSDTATLSGTASEPGAGGPGGDTGLYKSIYLTAPSGLTPADSSITWVLYGPGGTPANCDPNNTKATSPASATVSGDATYGPTSYKPVAADGVGLYTFVANYGGDGVNTNAAATNTCASPGTGETVTISGSVGSSSKQGWLPNDRITVTSTSGTTLSGSVVATLYRGTFTGSLASCAVGTATSVYTQTLTVSSATNTATVNTTNTGTFIGVNPATGAAGEVDGSYFWLIHLNITGLTNAADRCETTTISHNDG
jgi:hypothetical protein